MTQLLIAPTPTPPPSGTGNANALSQGDATFRFGESEKAENEGRSESPFAAVLKSRVENRTAGADTANNTTESAAPAQTDAEELAINVDLSLIFPLLGANVSGPASIVMEPSATTKSSIDEKLVPEFDTGAQQVLLPILAALPTALLPSTSLPSAEKPAVALPSDMQLATVTLPAVALAPPTPTTAALAAALPTADLPTMVLAPAAPPTAALATALQATATPTTVELPTAYVTEAPTAAAPAAAPTIAAPAAAVEAAVALPAAAPPIASRAAANGPTPVPTAILPTAPVPKAVLTDTSDMEVPTAIPPTAAPPLAPIATKPITPSVVTENDSEKQNVGTVDEAFSSAGSARPGATGQIPGKIAPDAAINADVGHKSGETQVADLPVSDFQAHMERAAAMAPAAASLTSSASSNPSLRVDTPFGQAGWHDEVGQKLTWMVSNNRQQADLVLNPPQLGRVEVSLTMNGDQATAVFVSSNPAVREALENSLHRLREVLADAGVSLGQTQVGSESTYHSSRNDELDFGMNDAVRYAASIPLPRMEAVARTSAGRSMIDIFA